MARHQVESIEQLQVDKIKTLDYGQPIDVEATLNFADDSGSATADLASAVGTLTAVIVIQVDGTSYYVPAYVAYTAT